MREVNEWGEDSLGNTVDLERSNDGKPGHADKLGRGLLDDGHAPNAVHVAGEALRDFVEEVPGGVRWIAQLDLLVDLVDELEVAGEEVLEEREGPLLKGLGEDGVVGVRKHLGGDLPRNVVRNLLLVDEDAHELDDGDGRVGVVH